MPCLEALDDALHRRLGAVLAHALENITVRARKRLGPFVGGRLANTSARRASKPRPKKLAAS